MLEERALSDDVLEPVPDARESLGKALSIVREAPDFPSSPCGFFRMGEALVCSKQIGSSVLSLGSNSGAPGRNRTRDALLRTEAL